jgi:L-ascorbate metabolism protein UlaG (beta-lactamase superfamily)
MKKSRIFLGIVLSSFFAASLNACQAPIIRNGRYYNDAQDDRWHLVDGAKIAAVTKLHAMPYGICDRNIWYEQATPPERSQEPLITWIGHASFLIQIGGINIITDPVFGNLSFLYPRQSPAGLSPKQLPHIDYVLISHNHRNHLDLPSLSRLKADHSPIFLVPENTTISGFGKIIEKTWGGSESHTASGITFTFLPAYHWSGTNLFDTRKALWGSWMITHNNHTIYFAGDSAYGPHFRDIATLFPHIDVALMPIAPGEPHEYTKYSHMNASEAVQAFLDLNAQTFIPIHWGTFQLGPDSFDYPLTMLRQAWQSYADRLTQKNLTILKFGGHWTNMHT